MDLQMPTDAPISGEERGRRKKAVNCARSSVRLEGFVLDADIEALNQRYINGETAASILIPYFASDVDQPNSRAGLIASAALRPHNLPQGVQCRSRIRM